MEKEQEHLGISGCLLGMCATPISALGNLGIQWSIVYYNLCTFSLVLNTFKRSIAERVPSECSQPRYTCDISEYLF